MRCHEQSEEQPVIAVRQKQWRYVLIVVDGTWRQAKEMYKVQNNAQASSRKVQRNAPLSPNESYTHSINKQACPPMCHLWPLQCPSRLQCCKTYPCRSSGHGYLHQ